MSWMADNSDHILFPFEDLLEELNWVVGAVAEGNAFPDINSLAVGRL